MEDNSYQRGRGKQKRRFISAKTKDGLYSKLYEFYVGPGTLNDIHNRWEEERKQKNLAAKTVAREQERWDKYISGSPLSQKRIDEIDNFQLEDLLYSIIRNQSVTTKELGEIVFLLRHTFKYAHRHKMISSNPVLGVEINKAGCAPAKPRLSQSRIYLPDEVVAMQQEIDTEMDSIPYNSTALAIRLLFQTGIRIGEAVALRASDIDFVSRTVHIQRMEQDGEIVNHTKKKSEAGDRILPLGQAGIEVINQILAVNRTYGFQDEDFLFLGEKGTRIHIRALDNRIRKLCRRAGILPEKSAHDIRRTVATTLYRKTHDIELVRQFLGHSDVKTTWGYIVLIDEEEEDRRRVVEALKCLSEPPKASGGNIIEFSPKTAQRRKMAGATRCNKISGQ